MTAVETFPGPPSSTTDRRPNLRLRRLLAETGLSRQAFARRVRDRLAAAGTPCPAMCVTYVSRWIAGVQPRPHTAAHALAVLSHALGREVTAAEAGFSTPTRAARIPLVATDDYRVPLAAGDLLAELESLRAQVDRLSSMLVGAAS
jgi:hypothetical protein